MNFGKLLLKEIERKRKTSQPTPASKKTKQNVPSASEAPSVEDQFLASVPDDKLQQSLQSLEQAPDEDLSKAEQLHKLEILVRHEKKNARYKAYLDMENDVDVTIHLEDIGSISEKDSSTRLAMQVRKFIKQIVRNWESAPSEKFPESLLTETKRDLVKLMYKLRSGKLKRDMLVSLCTIVYYIQTENFTKANEAYMKLSIGNVAWPIGVRDVGIHARSADAKITGDNKDSVANIMQNERTRLWIIAVKRLLNYSEQSYLNLSRAVT